MSVAAHRDFPCAALAELLPDWEAPAHVKAMVTGRRGGVSRGRWGQAGGAAGGLNLGTGCGDDPAAVAGNRARLAALLPSPPRWLRQVHGTTVYVAEARRGPGPGGGAPGAPDAPDAAQVDPQADAAVTRDPGVVLAVLTADCLPVLMTDALGRAVAVAHAGWRGTALGVIERTVEALCGQAGAAPEDVIAWLGPAIGPRAFEVGEDVLQAFCEADPASRSAFAPGPREGKWFADLYRLARMRLAGAGVTRIRGGGHCTVHEPGRFYSHRRDRVSGRMASLIWLEPGSVALR